MNKETDPHAEWKQFLEDDEFLHWSGHSSGHWFGGGAREMWFQVVGFIGLTLGGLNLWALFAGNQQNTQMTGSSLVGAAIFLIVPLAFFLMGYLSFRTRQNLRYAITSKRLLARVGKKGRLQNVRLRPSMRAFRYPANCLVVGTLRGNLLSSVLPGGYQWLAIWGPVVPGGMVFFNLEDAQEALRVAGQQIKKLQISNLEK